MCCLEHLVRSVGTLVARKLQLQEGEKEGGGEKNANKTRGGKQRQSAGLRIIRLICLANLIFKTGGVKSRYCEINSGSSYFFSFSVSSPTSHLLSLVWAECAFFSLLRYVSQARALALKLAAVDNVRSADEAERCGARRFFFFFFLRKHAVAVVLPCSKGQKIKWKS